jgi:hypothetical protein
MNIIKRPISPSETWDYDTDSTDSNKWVRVSAPAPIVPRSIRYYRSVYIESTFECGRKLLVKIDPMITDSYFTFLAFNFLRRLGIAGPFDASNPDDAITIGIPACDVELWLRAKILFNPIEKADVIVGASDIFFNNIDIDFANKRIFVGTKSTTPHHGNFDGDFEARILPINSN